MDFLEFMVDEYENSSYNKIIDEGAYVSFHLPLDSAHIPIQVLFIITYSFFLCTLLSNVQSFFILFFISKINFKKIFSILNRNLRNTICQISIISFKT